MMAISLFSVLALGSLPVRAYSSSNLYPRCTSSVASPPSSTICVGPSPPGKLSAWFVHHQYSSSVSPFQAYTGTPVFAMAAAA